ncbi:MAG: tetratricopeptide repeat protein [Candidatus Aminicenantes bacterium]|nr:MAG: tetratricopeptide repeat protein [Candidatus Aminicenantes bacterium]
MCVNLIKKGIKPILALLLFFSVTVVVFSQDKQDDESKQLREEILAVYQAKGDQGLRNFVKKKKNQITNTFIVDFAEEGMNELKEEWLKACEIIAKEKRDEKVLADVLFYTGKYFIYVSDHENGMNFLLKALNLYIKLNDLDGQANVYFGKGMIYYLTEGTQKSLKMFDKALPLFQKSKDYKGEGNVYWRKGDIYSRLGDYTNAKILYDKALLLFKKVNFYTGMGNVYYSKGKNYFRAGNNSSALEMYNRAQHFFEKAGEYLGQGNVYQSRGDYYRNISDYSKAIDMYDKALILFKKVNDPVGIGQNLLRKGDIYTGWGMNEKALESFDEALSFLVKADHPSGQGHVYQKKGDIYLLIGDNLKALEMYNKSIKFLKKADDFIGIGNVLLRIGDIYFNSGDKSRALLMYGKAITSYEEVGEIRGQGIVFQRYGLIYADNGDYQRSLEQYDKALIVFEKIGNLLGLANIYLAKGFIYFKNGKNSKAFEMYAKAITFYEKVGSPQGQGNVFESLGTIHFFTGDNIKALEMCEKALHFFEKTEAPIGQGHVYKRRGDIYKSTGNYSKSIEMYNKALLFYEKAGYYVGQGDVYRSKGDIYLYAENNLGAMNMYDKSLELYKKVGSQTGQGNVFGSKGKVYFNVGDNSKAMKMYEKALIYFLKVGDLLGEGNIYKLKGDIFFRLGNILGALDMYEKALSLYEKIGDIRSKFNTLYSKAKVFAKQGKKSEAINLFEGSLFELEKYRFKTAIAELKKNLMEIFYDKYEETVLFMLENKYYEKAFKYAESMRSRVFLDRMAEGLVRLDKGLTPELKEKQDNLVTKLSLLSKDIHQTAGGNYEKKLKELKEKYSKVEAQFEELLVKIRLENPLYASVRYPQPITVQELQNQVLKKGEILVRYFISPGKLYVFLISKRKFNVVQLEVKKQEIKGYVQQYLGAIKENDSIRMKRYGKILYENLFKPLEKRIKKSKDIIIVPDGELATIPFESLIIDNKKQDRPVFLLEKYRVKYLQSASLLKILRQYYQNNRESNNFIGFGDPVYDYENFKLGKPEKGSKKILATESIFSHEDTRSDTKEKRLSSVPSVSSVATASPQAFGNEIKEIHRDRYARAGGIMDRLPASGEEVKTIARLFEKKSQKSVIHLRDKATEDNANTPGMKDFDYIHFTCHGLLNDDFQSLVLSQDIPGTKDDGYFTLNEIMNCDYNAKLVVLSACQTGSGKLERAEGVTGMTRAVMYAGTPAVAASLWKVDDEATKELMINFYRNMLEKNLEKTEALRQAKLALIKNKKYRSPLFWSAFVMYGE